MSGIQSLSHGSDVESTKPFRRRSSLRSARGGVLADRVESTKPFRRRSSLLRGLRKHDWVVVESTKPFRRRSSRISTPPVHKGKTLSGIQSLPAGVVPAPHFSSVVSGVSSFTFERLARLVASPFARRASALDSPFFSTRCWRERPPLISPHLAARRRFLAAFSS